MRNLIACGGLAVLAATACDLAPTGIVIPEPGAPATLTVLQDIFPEQAVVGTTLPALVFSVEDAAGIPVHGESLDVEVRAGGGSFTIEHPGQPQYGTVRVFWTLGTSPGANQLVVSAPWTETEYVFDVQAVAGAASQLRAVAGDEQTGVPGEPLAEDIVVRVTDAEGNPIAGDYEVLFHYVTGEDQDGEAAVDTTVVTLEGEAEARYTWTLPASGSHTLTAEVYDAGFDPEEDEPIATREFTAVGETGPVASIAAVSGDGAEGAAGETVDLVVEVTDEWGTPVVGEDVFFTVVAGDGAVFNPRARTDAEGMATMEYTFGDAEDQAVEASAAGHSVTFTMTREAD
jgi:hypothetical protein